MPIYEYKCEACGKEFEEIVYGDDTPACPACKSDKTSKLMSCCRFKNAGGVHGERNSKAPMVGYNPTGASKCSGCSGGNCSSC
ncbi:MAG: zinc ribbon domain-containing protein [Desulfovibrionaceae bacterium]